MMGLLHKDLYLIRKDETTRFILGLAALVVVLGVMGVYGTSVVSCGLMVLFFLQLVLYTCELDAIARWDRFAACAPCGRDGVVAAKYLLALILLGAGLLLAFLHGLLLLALGRDGGGLAAALRSAAFGGGLGCFVAAGALPIRFKLGGWHGMGWQFLWGAGAFALLVFGGGILALSLRVELAVVWAWSLLPGAALLGVSYPLSLRFYRTREF